MAGIKLETGDNRWLGLLLMSLKKKPATEVEQK